MHASLAGPHAIAPERMTPEERIAEIGRILGVGLVRLAARKSSPLIADGGECCLDFSPDQRSHADGLTKQKA
jgi:hypothetical protein